MIKRFYLFSSLLFLCTGLSANIVQAQDATQQGQSAAGIANLLDNFAAEPVELSDEQQNLYNDEAFNFKEDPEATQTVRSIWLGALEDMFGSEDAAVEAEKTFGPDNIQELVSEVFGDSGFKVSNYFDVLAMEVISNMYIAQNVQKGTPTEGDIQIRDQMVSVMTSQQILEHRKKDNASRQTSQQVTALATMWRLHVFLGERNAGNPVDQLQKEAETRLIEKWFIDPRFQAITAEGMGMTEELTDVVSGKKTVDAVYPDLDLVALSESSPVPATKVVATVLQILKQAEGSEGLGDNSAENPDVLPSQQTNDSANDANKAGTETDLAVNPIITAPKGDAINPLAARRSAFAGQFKGDGLSLSLDVQNANATGSLVFNGQQYPVEGVVTEDSMNGNFKSGADEFPFEAFVDDDQIRFETGGATYNLSGE